MKIKIDDFRILLIMTQESCCIFCLHEHCMKASSISFQDSPQSSLKRWSGFSLQEAKSPFFHLTSSFLPLSIYSFCVYLVLSTTKMSSQILSRVSKPKCCVSWFSFYCYNIIYRKWEYVFVHFAFRTNTISSLIYFTFSSVECVAALLYGMAWDPEERSQISTGSSGGMRGQGRRLYSAVM